ncbi:molybdenum cofactor biosynthesis protein MoaE [Calycomorphotria hydatis]|uniref:Molybdopterin synthase catalytic subunit n=1 Tax=Calycomorphotria hydatis TaxID=2528027 RepID=A0A517T534_9PLAN|nr:molybdenum cofactor biosynthesis protein MoaE [Calycomorphotria hydatis]QDT63487.1 Molybdopterin synthase catalytic subunit 1 [Calycomorphotria hydatis]
MIELTRETIQPEQLLAAVQSLDCGAVTLFLGTVREITGERATTRLEYEAFEPMAVAEMEKLAAGAREKWELGHIAIQHRLGVLDPGEIAVGIAVSAPHRAAAFDAGRFLIDEMKESVPIWKKEFWADGEVEWVHPGSQPGEAP